MNKYNSKSVKCKETGRKIPYFVDKTYFLLIRCCKKWQIRLKQASAGCFKEN